MRLRYSGMGYIKQADDMWRLTVDGGVVGDVYRSKAELLADVERQARIRGFAPPDPLAQLGARVLEILAEHNTSVRSAKSAAEVQVYVYRVADHVRVAARSLGLLGEEKPK